MTEFEPCL